MRQRAKEGIHNQRERERAPWFCEDGQFWIVAWLVGPVGSVRHFEQSAVNSWKEYMTIIYFYEVCIDAYT